MELSCPENLKALSYFSRSAGDRPVWASWKSAADPYMRSGCHPEIVERLWDQLGVTLPEDCRAMVYGFPGLVHPVSGVILGMGLGTQYGLRLSPELLPQALAAGVKTQTIWGVKQKMDIQEALGPDWIFGAWLPLELEWCQLIFRTYNRKQS